jgi:hypothetical protein
MKQNHKLFKLFSTGNGPRICIGQKFGKITTKIGLFFLLEKFNFQIFGKTNEADLKFSPKQFVLVLEEEIFLKVTHRKLNQHYVDLSLTYENLIQASTPGLY